jgi:hypothetical protein
VDTTQIFVNITDNYVIIYTYIFRIGVIKLSHDPRKRNFLTIAFYIYTTCLAYGVRTDIRKKRNNYAGGNEIIVIKVGEYR